MTEASGLRAELGKVLERVNARGPSSPRCRPGRAREGADAVREPFDVELPEKPAWIPIS